MYHINADLVKSREWMRWLHEQFWKEECLGQKYNSKKQNKTMYHGIKALHTNFHQEQRLVFMISSHLSSNLNARLHHLQCMVPVTTSGWTLWARCGGGADRHVDPTVSPTALPACREGWETQAGCVSWRKGKALWGAAI